MSAITINDLLPSLREEIALNDHGEACRMASQRLGRPDLALQFQSIRQRQMEHGHLTPLLSCERETHRLALLAHAKECLDPGEFVELRQII